MRSKETDLSTASYENPLRSKGTEQPLDQPERARVVAVEGPPQQMEQLLIVFPPLVMNTSSLSNQLNDLSLNDSPTPSTIKNDLPTQSSSIRFQLRSRDVPIRQKPKIPTKGLGVNARITSKGKGRGIPSHLSMAQSMALRDQASGRQTTIFGVLRIVQTLDGVPK